MRLIFQIFRKDVRHLAVPIILLILIEAAVAIVDVQNHLSGQTPLPRSSLSPGFSPLPFAWIFLVSAVVLQEGLVDTTQYWLTRPIGWPKLLAAKFLFVAIFLNASWFLSDCATLLSLHLPIQPTDLLLRQIPMTILLLLPALCLTTVSGSMGQIAFGLIVIVLGFMLEVLLPMALSSTRANAFDVNTGVFFYVFPRAGWFFTALAALTM